KFSKISLFHLVFKNRGWLVLECLWRDNRSDAPGETGNRSCKSQVSDLSRLCRAVNFLLTP
ncbi:MAG: hypothetical protein QNJ63_09210, partial [Calothrix sp. MO_192.B10]|nr:hypothetical protein [Calothrix sp. MO_192.B10]